MKFSIRQQFKDRAPAHLISLVLHIVVLGLLGLITWAVVSPPKPDPVLSLAPEDILNPKLQDKGAPQNDGLQGAAGNNSGDAAPGPMSEQLVLPPPASADQPFPDPAASMELLSPELPKTSNAHQTQLGGLMHNLADIKGPIGGSGGLGGQGKWLRGTGKDFGSFIGLLQDKGLDVVLVLDATDSMSPYIDQSKKKLQEIIDVVTGLVPKARFGMVVYKDYGDDYGSRAAKAVRITDKVDNVRSFLARVTVGGGGDEPEPIQEALKVATDVKSMNWAVGRTWVMILVGDSSIHASGRKPAFQLAKKFAQAGGTINVIDVGGVSRQGNRRETIQPDLQKIAQNGRGEAFFLKEENEFWRHLIVSIFGQRYKSDIDVILKKYTRNEE